MKDQTFGIEIEMNHISRARAAGVVAEHFGTRAEYVGGTYDTWRVADSQGRYWKLVSDSSIDGPYEERTEFVSPVCRWGTSRRCRNSFANCAALAPRRTAAVEFTSTSGGVSTRPGRSEIW